MTPRFNILISVFLLIVGLPSAQSALIVASHDNYVLNSQSGTIQGSGGTSENLVLKRASNNIRKSWLKFDLAGLNADTSQSGTVTLTLAGDTSTKIKIALYALDDTGGTAPVWTEGSITWSNAPGNDTSGNFAEINGLEAGETTLLGETAELASGTAAGTSYQFTIPTLSTFVQADNSLTVIAIASFQNDSGPSTGIASSENATAAWRPTLEYAVIPEPSSLALMLVAGLGATAFLKRRRR